MPVLEIKSLFEDAIRRVASDIRLYAVNPDTDFARSRKLPPELLLSFLVSMGSSSVKNELLDFFGMDASSPVSSAFFQQRAKLKPEAVEAVFNEFSASVRKRGTSSGFRFLAADGSTATFFSKPELTPQEYFVKPGHSARGFYSIHINALYDLGSHAYVDALLQPVHEKDEFRAFCDMVDRQPFLPGETTVFIGDRGYCSYNNMAHVIEAGQCFLFRAKDIHSKGMLKGFDFPDRDSFDIAVKVALVRTNSKKLQIAEGCRRFIDKATSFDFLEYGSHETYGLSFRIVRLRLPDGSFEALVTNLPPLEFPLERLKEVYFSRWGIETSFRKLKYTIGLSNFHSYRSEYVRQEIWARLVAYNAAEAMAGCASLEGKDTKHEYKVNFSVAAHICRILLRLATEGDPANAMALLERELVPIRRERHYPRLQTAHFRKPRYCNYRAS